MEKTRSAGVVAGETVVGDVGDATVVILDDLISTGTTMVRAAGACRELGAQRVLAAATHGLFVGDAEKVIGEGALEKVVITDSVPPFRLDPQLLRSKIVVLEAAPLFAEAIGRIHAGGSIVELLGD
jgi:ribose-phosphate pyrophosphokinase